MSGVIPSSFRCRWEIFNPMSKEFKGAERAFHRLVWWRQALTVSASIVAGLFFVVGAFPVFCWTARVLAKGKNKTAENISQIGKDHLGPVTRHNIVQQPNPFSVLTQQIGLAIKADQKSTANSWAKSCGAKEKEQTLKSFEQDPHTKANAHRKKIHIYFMGTPSKEDEKIVKIVSDYLEALNGVKAHEVKDHLDLIRDDSRMLYDKKQYSIEYQIGLLMTLPHEDCFLIGVTNQDLYPQGYNFVFGASCPKHAMGVFSSNRLSQGSFNKTLVRMMKLATHEFGHMRGILHCTKYCCTMQGINNLTEADEAPLTFCAQDMAKICLVNGWSLKEAYSQQLDFFEKFNSQYGLDIDFTKEITHLKKKIAALSNL